MDFDSAPRDFAEKLMSFLGAEEAKRGRIVRDVFGKMMFVTKHKAATAVIQALGADLVRSNNQFVDLTYGPIATVDKETFAHLCSESTYRIDMLGQGETEVKLIDRKLVGDEWLISPQSLKSEPKVLIFYSIKGGVGRSTALAVTAAHLASQGKNILTVDFDLEAPALGNLLLEGRLLPSYGTVDWFSAVAAGVDTVSLIPEMIGSSAFTSSQSIVDVVPCYGAKGGNYLSKLARAYTPGSAGNRMSRANFAEKARQLLDDLIERRQYDVVLIDARAGLHETSGSLLLGLGARSLLFGIDTSQTFDGYNLLLSALSEVFSPETGNRDLRGSFKMVHAKAPQDPGQRTQFRASSWKAWSETMYDDEDLGQAGEISLDKFIFDVGDDSAPHYPLEIVGSEGYARFEPRNQAYLLEERSYEPVFGSFLGGVMTMLDLPK